MGQCLGPQPALKHSELHLRRVRRRKGAPAGDPPLILELPIGRPDAAATRRSSSWRVPAAVSWPR
ncbi:MAG: hypothetical protein MZV70_37630 [Desulfobacterales bacterium]|nr:hypothetical protein [Desulfobacterales bacterium]